MVFFSLRSFNLHNSVIHIDRRVNMSEHPKPDNLFACHLLTPRLQASRDL